VCNFFIPFGRYEWVRKAVCVSFTFNKGVFYFGPHMVRLRRNICLQEIIAVYVWWQNFESLHSSLCTVAGCFYYPLHPYTFWWCWCDEINILNPSLSLCRLHRVWKLSTDWYENFLRDGQGRAQDFFTGAETERPKIDAEGRDRGWSSASPLPTS